MDFIPLEAISQLPALCIFVLFVLKREAQFENYLGKRDNDIKEYMERMTTQIAKNTTCLMLHDATSKGVEKLPSYDTILKEVMKGE